MRDWLRRRCTLRALANTLPVTVAVLIAAVLSVNYNLELRSSRAAVVMTWEMIAATERLTAEALELETGQRGFVITGDPAFLTAYDRAAERLRGTFDELAGMFNGRPEGTARVAALRSAFETERRALSETVRLRQEVGFEAARDRVARNASGAMMDRLRARIGELRARESERLAERAAQVDRSERLLVVVALLGTVLTVGARVVTRLVLRRRRRAVRQAEVA